ncbi:hypothetical protein [Microbacterium hominis]|uniref:Uncharacterized protein n=1 Tax=Microbacterium hominis TaxID=162426 RepID=A0A7D4Q1C5_9MICO|nr:hypothetical protein [Microbacterium hominis]QKJ19718.1 hypothetical protein HQM25_10305 [Microbacterium hominis]
MDASPEPPSGLRRGLAVPALVALVALTGCAASTSSPAESASASPAPPLLDAGERALDPGTYRMEPSQLQNAAFPTVIVTVPEGWTSVDGWAIHSENVGVSLWNVDKVFGHPCQWQGTAFAPGDTADDLVAALVEVPLRNPTTPEPVEIDGRPGTYFEWSVPSDIAHDGDGFPDCDSENGQPHDFVSWTGVGTPSLRYHQGPGQVDYVWVLDMDGERMVIDAYSMPDATDEAIAEIHDIVSTMRFVDG